MVKLSGKCALVTGGARGIGAAAVRALSGAGAEVAFTYLSHEESAHRLVNEIADEGGRVVAFAADLRNRETLNELILNVTERVGPIGILVNNAALVVEAVWNDITPDLIDSSFAVNTRAPLLLACAVADHMRRSGIAGSIINISSLNGRIPTKGGIVYSATKAALEALTRGLALELGAFGIRVNAVAPGLTATERRTATLDLESERAVVAQTPLGRLGTAPDVSRVIVFLASEEAGWITGEVITVSGGLGL